ncbi:MAG: hypothetical protein M5U01_18570 [Ardenticatenaceae bacterium]|nr:hypothetical protein [Ardenticatenaceae bacterium]
MCERIDVDRPGTSSRGLLRLPQHHHHLWDECFREVEKQLDGWAMEGHHRTGAQAKNMGDEQHVLHRCSQIDVRRCLFPILEPESQRFGRIEADQNDGRRGRKHPGRDGSQLPNRLGILDDYVNIETPVAPTRGPPCTFQNQLDMLARYRILLEAAGHAT